jgi:hypothetical protein
MYKKFLSFMLISAMALSPALGCGCGKPAAQEEVPADTSTELSLAPLTEDHGKALEEGDAEIASAANTVGLMACYPNSNTDMYALAGSNEVTFYFQNQGITGGAGRVGVYDQMTSALYATASPGTDGHVSELDDNGKELTGWESGTKIDVFFDRTFQAGKTYYILLDAAAFMFDQVESEPVANASLITFGVKEYGITGDLYEDYDVGDTISINVVLGGDAKTAQLKNYDTAQITPTASTFTQSESFDITFNEASSPKFTIAFFDDAGQQIDSMDFAFGIGGMMADLSTPVADDGSSIDQSAVDAALQEQEQTELDDAGVVEGEEVPEEEPATSSEEASTDDFSSFPQNPADGDTYTDENGAKWKYDGKGIAWVPVTPAKGSSDAVSEEAPEEVNSSDKTKDKASSSEASTTQKKD